MSRRNENNSIYVIPVIFIAVLMIFIAYFFMEDRKDQKLYEEYAREENQKIYEQENQKQASLMKLEASDNFYQKLKDGFNVNILIVGDSIGAGSGSSASEKAWTSLLSRSIDKTYGVKAHVTNISMGGNTSYAGYVRTMTLKDDIDYDLAIICYGQNDRVEEFSLYYESIIASIWSKYDNCDIISILESSQRDYTEKMNTIKNICDYYKIPIADTIKAFNDSKIDYDQLSEDKVHPNDKGYEIYFETINDVISKEIENPEKKYNNDKPSDKRINEFYNFKYISNEEFERVDDNTYKIACNADDATLGIDYSYMPGENKTEIYIDGVLYKAPTVKFSYDFSQKHIDIVSDHISVSDEIEIKFSTKESADQFGGIVLNRFK